jgi:hypothetical protein
MGFLGGIGKALGGVIKQVAPKIIQAVAPAATKLLQGVVGDAFQVGGAALKALAGRLPGPLGGLAQNLLGKFLPKLQNLAEGGIEKLINKLAGSITNRLAPGAGNVALPPMSDPSRTAAITNPANAPSTGSTHSASPATGSSSSAATSGGAPASANGPTVAGAGNEPPKMPTDWTKMDQVQKYNAEMQLYQMQMQGMQQHFQMMSNIIKSQGDTAKALVGNLR